MKFEEHVKQSNIARKPAAMVYLLHKFFSLMESEKRFVSQQKGEEMCAGLTRMLCMYSELSHEAVQGQVCLWPMIPKFHACLHFAQNLRRFRENPRYSHTFVDEDWMGQLKRHAPTFLSYPRCCCLFDFVGLGLAHFMPQRFCKGSCQCY